MEDKGIKNKLITGVIWESVGQFSALFIQIVVTIIIARILSPSDFGVFGLLMVFVAVSAILLDSGFSQALIQKKDADDNDYSTVFWINVVLGVLIYAILYVTCPYISDFYNIPELTYFARILFLIIPISSFGLVENVIIQKKLQFKKSATATVISAILSGVIGVTLAYKDFGIMSLVVQQVSLYAFRSILYILQMRWVPKLKVSINNAKSMFGFSMKLMFHSLIDTVMQNVYTLVIGKYYSAEQVGYYNQANKFQQISANSITSIIMRVSLPSIVPLKDDINRIRDAYARIIAMTCFLMCPLMYLLLCIADQLVTVLLTDKWQPMVVYFQILCLYGITLPILQISYNIYKIYTKGGTLLILDSIRHLLFIISILLTIKLGIIELLIGQFVVMSLMTIVNMYFSGKLICYSVGKQISNISPYYVLSLLTAVIVWFTPKINNIILVDLIIKSLEFIAIYLSLSYVFKPKAAIESVGIIKSIIAKIRQR